MFQRHRDSGMRNGTIAVACCLAALLFSSGGCELPVASESAAAKGGPPEPVYPEPIGEGSDAEPAPGGATKGGVDGSPHGAGGATGGATDGATDGGGDVVKAQPFVGKIKRNEAGFITTPINVYFSVKQQITFDQIRNGLKFFESLEGRKPKDMDEVIARIVKPRALVLPELQPGDKYIFDPEAGPHGDIMVQKAPK